MAIPSIGGNGGVLGLRFRNLAPDSNPKYLGLSGAPTRLFNARAIVTANDDICITEGELDAVVLTQCGLSAVGVTGASNWKRHHPRMFAGFQRVFIFGDGDKAGTSFSKEVNDSLSNGVRISLPTGKDVNDLYMSDGRRAILDLIEDI